MNPELPILVLSTVLIISCGTEQPGNEFKMVFDASRLVRYVSNGLNVRVQTCDHSMKDHTCSDELRIDPIPLEGDIGLKKRLANWLESVANIGFSLSKAGEKISEMDGILERLHLDLAEAPNRFATEVINRQVTEIKSERKKWQADIDRFHGFFTQLEDPVKELDRDSGVYEGYYLGLRRLFGVDDYLNADHGSAVVAYETESKEIKAQLAELLSAEKIAKEKIGNLNSQKSREEATKNLATKDYARGDCSNIRDMGKVPAEVLAARRKYKQWRDTQADKSAPIPDEIRPSHETLAAFDLRIKDCTSIARKYHDADRSIKSLKIQISIAESGYSAAVRRSKELGDKLRSKLDELIPALGFITRESGSEVIISGFFEDSPSAKAGLKEGDKLLTVDGGSIRSTIDVYNAQYGYVGKDSIVVGVKRSGVTHHFRVQLYEAPQTPSTPKGD